MSARHGEEEKEKSERRTRLKRRLHLRKDLPDRGIHPILERLGPRALKVSTPLWGGIRVRYPRRPTKTNDTPLGAPSDGGSVGVVRVFLAVRIHDLSTIRCSRPI